jgi:hypothetical protein
MKKLAILMSLASVCYAQANVAHFSTSNNKEIVAYFLTDTDSNTLAKLQDIAANPSKYPFTRINLSFINPHINYATGNTDTSGTGIAFSDESGNVGPIAISDLKGYIEKIKASGKEVYFTVGGWDFGLGGDGNTLPGLVGKNYDFSKYNDKMFFKNGSDGGFLYFQSLLLYPTSQSYPLDSNGKCLHDAVGQTPGPDNNWCYVVEPSVTGIKASDYSSFPYPVDYPQSLLPSGSGLSVPQTDYYKMMVQFVKDTGANGIDVDYEEFPQADWYRQEYNPDTGVISSGFDHNLTSAGPWVMQSSVNKITYIISKVEKEAKAANIDVQITAPAVGAIPIQGPWNSGKQWWGGNLKGLIYNIINYSDSNIPSGKSLIQNATGGIGVMTYDVSSNQKNSECPFATDAFCSLKYQVGFYMNSYLYEFQAANLSSVKLFFGVETQTPAYPRPEINGAWNPDSLPLYVSNSGVPCGNTGALNGGCDINSVFSKTATPFPTQTVFTDPTKLADYYQQNPGFSTDNFQGVILWELFKNSPSSLPGYVDKNPNNSQYIKPMDVINYFLNN